MHRVTILCCHNILTFGVGKCIQEHNGWRLESAKNCLGMHGKLEFCGRYQGFFMMLGRENVPTTILSFKQSQSLLIFHFLHIQTELSDWSVDFSVLGLLHGLIMKEPQILNSPKVCCLFWNCYVCKCKPSQRAYFLQ